jgi:protoporphyrinogen oxidase
VTRNGVQWAILGGGMLGLRLAQKLSSEGCAVTVFEAASCLGGLASAWDLDGIVWDRHYHVILASDRCTQALVAELGLSEEMRWKCTRTGFFTDGRLISMSNALEYLLFPPIGPIDKIRLALTILYASRIRDYSQLDHIPVAAWLQKWSGRRTFEKVWLPLLRAKLGNSYEDTSAAFICSVIARLYGARQSGGSRTEQMGYLQGGYATLLASYAERLRRTGVDIRLNQATRRVEPVDGGVRVTLTSGVVHHFDNVVLTVPSPVAATVCDALTGSEIAALRKIRYQGVICASVLLRRSLAGFYVTNITDPALPFTGVIEMSALVDKSQFRGHTLVYLPKYAAPDDPVFGCDDREIQRTFVEGLRTIYPDLLSEDILAFRVSRARYVMPIPTLGYSEMVPPMSTSLPGVFIVNSSQIVNGTLNVNETLQLADRAAQYVTSIAHSRGQRAQDGHDRPMTARASA